MWPLIPPAYTKQRFIWGGGGGGGGECPKKIGELSTLPLFDLKGSIKNDLSVCDGFPNISLPFEQLNLH